VISTGFNHYSTGYGDIFGLPGWREAGFDDFFIKHAANLKTIINACNEAFEKPERRQVDGFNLV
jgi:hypothetical protein